MILYKADATYKQITDKIRRLFHLEVIDDKHPSVEKQVMQCVGYAAQLRIKVAVQPVFDSLSRMDNLLGALNYESPVTDNTPVHTNMGLLFRKGQR